MTQVYSVAAPHQVIGIAAPHQVIGIAAPAQSGILPIVTRWSARDFTRFVRGRQTFNQLVRAGRIIPVDHVHYDGLLGSETVVAADRGARVLFIGLDTVLAYLGAIGDGRPVHIDAALKRLFDGHRCRLRASFDIARLAPNCDA